MQALYIIINYAGLCMQVLFVNLMATTKKRYGNWTPEPRKFMQIIALKKSPLLAVLIYQCFQI